LLVYYLSPPQRDEAEGIGMLLIGFVAFAGFFAPVAGAEGGKVRVALEAVMDFGEVNNISGGQGGAVDFTAADDEPRRREARRRFRSRALPSPADV
jgi:hypothetical protein